MQHQSEHVLNVEITQAPPAPQIFSGARQISYAEILQRAQRAATGFKTQGMRTGDAVALLLRNDLAFFEASVAANLAGAAAVPINWHLRGDEISYILQDSGAKALVVHADLLSHLSGLLSEALIVLVVATPPEIAEAYGIAQEARDVPEGQLDWTAWVEQYEPAAVVEEMLPPPVIYTSGTTGRPKGVHRAAATPELARETAALAMMVLGLEPGIRTMVTGPMYHSAPNAFGLAMAAAGAQVWLQPRFDAEDLLAAIDRHRLTHLFVVPTMFVRLLKLSEEVRSRYDVSSLRRVIHAAAPCSPDVKRRMIGWWGPVIAEFYGSTETSTVTYCTSQEWLARPGTVGKAVPNAVIQILDEEGRVLPPCEIGEIYARNYATPDFTYKGDAAKRAGLERDGLFTSGDVGYLDADGFLFLCDRRKDMVISGGVNIYPAEIEGCILGLPGVQDCAVFGIPSEEFGEALMAAVQLSPGASVDAAAVKAHVRKNLAAFKTPAQVQFMDELPREDSGKIFKRKLRDPYWAAAGRKI